MYLEDTIVAPATGPARGAVAIVRLSGPKAIQIVRAIWNPRNKATIEPRRLHLGDVIDPETRVHIDTVMAVEFPKPSSLTGEDVAELQCHGGSYVVNRIVSLAIRLGARMAEPGE